MNANRAHPRCSLAAAALLALACAPSCDRGANTPAQDTKETSAQAVSATAETIRSSEPPPTDTTAQTAPAGAKAPALGGASDEALQIAAVEGHVPGPGGSGYPGLVQFYDRKAGTLTLQPIASDPGGRMGTGPKTQLTLPGAPDAHTIIAAHDGVHVCVAAFRRERRDGALSETLRIARYAMADPRATFVEMPLEAIGPHAMYIHGDRCLVGGAAASIQTVDFGTRRASVERLASTLPHQPPNKAIDVFVDTDETLYAIDDVSRPFYAFAFDWNTEGAQRALSPTSRLITLPNTTNGHYNSAVATSDYTITVVSSGGAYSPGYLMHFYKGGLRDGVPDAVLDQFRGARKDPLVGGEMIYSGAPRVLGDTLFMRSKGIITIDIPTIMEAARVESVESGVVFVTDEDAVAKIPVERHDLGGLMVGDLTQLDGQLLAILYDEDEYKRSRRALRDRDRGRGRHRLEYKEEGMQVVRLKWDAKTRALTIDAKALPPLAIGTFVEAFEPR